MLPKKNTQWHFRKHNTKKLKEQEKRDNINVNWGGYIFGAGVGEQTGSRILDVLKFVEGFDG